MSRVHSEEPEMIASAAVEVVDGKRYAEEDIAPSKRSLKRRRRQEKSQIQGSDNSSAIDAARAINPDIARMDPPLLGDLVARQMKRFEPDSSTVELEDRRIPVTAFSDTSSWTQERTLNALPAFLEHFSGLTRQRLSQTATASPGQPHTLVIACAGLRAADLTRSLRVYQSKTSESGVVAKLFAKHIKLKDAIASVRITRMTLGVGTPQRLIDLIEQGALSVASIERIIIDASHVNEKQRGILDMRETLVPLMMLLTRSELKERYAEDVQRGTNRIDVLVY